jgi:selenocysteine lyase/cysteine desulfurase
VDPERFVLSAGARRFENWEFSYALVLGLGEAARYTLEVGIDTAQSRALALAAELREKVAALPGVRIADHGAHLSAIATAQIAGVDVKSLVCGLRRSGVNTSAALLGDGPRNAPEASATPIVRLSPHYYNTREEIDGAVAALGDALREHQGIGGIGS